MPLQKQDAVAFTISFCLLIAGFTLMGIAIWNGRNCGPEGIDGATAGLFFSGLLPAFIGFISLENIMR